MEPAPLPIEVDAFTTPRVWRIARRTQANTLADAVRQASAADGDTLRLWRAPGVWICVGDGAEAIATQAASAVAATAIALTGAYAFWRLGGEWLDLLAHGSAFDPEDENFAERRVAWTRFVHFDVAVVRLDSNTGGVLGARSTARDLDAALRRAARHASILS